MDLCTNLSTPKCVEWYLWPMYPEAAAMVLPNGRPPLPMRNVEINRLCFWLSKGTSKSWTLPYNLFYLENRARERGWADILLYEYIVGIFGWHRSEQLISKMLRGAEVLSIRRIQMSESGSVSRKADFLTVVNIPASSFLINRAPIVQSCIVNLPQHNLPFHALHFR